MNFFKSVLFTILSLTFTSSTIAAGPPLKEQKPSDTVKGPASPRIRRLLNEALHTNRRRNYSSELLQNAVNSIGSVELPSTIRPVSRIASETQEQRASSEGYFAEIALTTEGLINDETAQAKGKYIRQIEQTLSPSILVDLEKNEPKRKLLKELDDLEKKVDSLKQLETKMRETAAKEVGLAHAKRSFENAIQQIKERLPDDKAFADRALELAWTFLWAKEEAFPHQYIEKLRVILLEKGLILEEISPLFEQYARFMHKTSWANQRQLSKHNFSSIIEQLNETENELRGKKQQAATDIFYHSGNNRRYVYALSAAIFYLEQAAGPQAIDWSFRLLSKLEIPERVVASQIFARMSQALLRHDDIGNVSKDVLAKEFGLAFAEILYSATGSGKDVESNRFKRPQSHQKLQDSMASHVERTFDNLENVAIELKTLYETIGIADQVLSLFYGIHNPGSLPMDASPYTLVHLLQNHSSNLNVTVLMKKQRIFGITQEIKEGLGASPGYESDGKLLMSASKLDYALRNKLDLSKNFIQQPKWTSAGYLLQYRITGFQGLKEFAQFVAQFDLNAYYSFEIDSDATFN